MVDITNPSNTFNQTAFVYQKSGYQCSSKDALQATVVPEKKGRCGCDCDCGCSKKSDTKNSNTSMADKSKDFTFSLNKDLLVYLAIGVAVILIIK